MWKTKIGKYSEALSRKALHLRLSQIRALHVKREVPFPCIEERGAGCQAFSDGKEVIPGYKQSIPLRRSSRVSCRSDMILCARKGIWETKILRRERS